MTEPTYDLEDWQDDHEGDVYAASGHNRRHIHELQRLFAFQRVTTKVPPSYDGTSSWFAFEDALDDWCDIIELEREAKTSSTKSPRRRTNGGFRVEFKFHAAGPSRHTTEEEVEILRRTRCHWGCRSRACSSMVMKCWMTRRFHLLRRRSNKQE